MMRWPTSEFAFLKSAAARIAISSFQAAQFSVLANLQLKAQSKAVHALTFVGLCGRENQMQDLGAPRLAMLPSV